MNNSMKIQASAIIIENGFVSDNGELALSNRDIKDVVNDFNKAFKILTPEQHKRLIALAHSLTTVAPGVKREILKILK